MRLGTKDDGMAFRKRSGKASARSGSYGKGAGGSGFRGRRAAAGSKSTRAGGGVSTVRIVIEQPKGAGAVTARAVEASGRSSAPRKSPF